MKAAQFVSCGSDQAGQSLPGLERAHTQSTVRLSAVTGVAVASLVPAVFWPLFAYAVGAMFGYEFGLFTLVIAGLSIAALLSVVCGAIMLRQ